MKRFVKTLSLLAFATSLSGCSFISTTTYFYSGLNEPTDEISDLMREYDRNLDKPYAGQEFHNVTPKSMKRNYKIYKYKESCMTFLEYKDEIYQLGVDYSNRGYGVAQIAYLRVDNNADIYFTFCFYNPNKYTGIGHFSTEEKKVTYLKTAIKGDGDYAFNSVSRGAISNSKINLFEVDMEWTDYPYTSKCNFSSGYSMMSGLEHANFQDELPAEAISE